MSRCEACIVTQRRTHCRRFSTDLSASFTCSPPSQPAAAAPAVLSSEGGLSSEAVPSPSLSLLLSLLLPSPASSVSEESSASCPRLAGTAAGLGRANEVALSRLLLRLLRPLLTILP